ncbi:hypothetical protein WG66_010501, partial [Moniliophthora roreri]
RSAFLDNLGSSRYYPYISPNRTPSIPVQPQKQSIPAGYLDIKSLRRLVLQHTQQTISGWVAQELGLCLDFTGTLRRDIAHIAASAVLSCLYSDSGRNQ